MIDTETLNSIISKVEPLNYSGRVLATRGSNIIAQLPRAAISELCYIDRQQESKLPAQIVAFEGDHVVLAPFDNLDKLSPGASVHTTNKLPGIKVDDSILGSIIDPLGHVLYRFDENTLNAAPACDYSIYNKPPHPMKRKAINKQLYTGIKTIDSLIPIGYGQRIGIFSSAGLGKSTLLGMISKNAAVDVLVLALVGERGREVKEFIEHNLDAATRKRLVIVLATSDESSIRRRLAAHTATAVAEYFRDRSKKVLLLVDSLTRMARAIREVTLAAGELPVRQGYTSAVYTELPQLIERAGNNHLGSITAIYTILTGYDEAHDPLSEELKSLLDGHLVLNEKTLRLGLRPAIDPIKSISRLMPKIISNEQQRLISKIQAILARLDKDRDILIFGATPDAELSASLKVEEQLKALLNQSPLERANPVLQTELMLSIVQNYEKELN